MAEPSDAGIMDALSLSDIIEELRELIGTRREEIEGLPFGLYAAVGREGGDAEIKACAFCFREITSEDPLDDPLDTTDPVTTIVVDGDNRAIAGRHPKDATAWLRTWAKGLQQPIRPLDDRLTQALQDGASDDSGVLHRMVRTALDTAKRHRQTQHQNACEQRGRRRPPTTRARIGADFELVGWVALYMT